MEAQNREEELFAAALNLPSNEREGYLARACEDAPSLQSRIGSLLRIVDSHRLRRDVSAMAREEVVGDHIGNYRLLEEIGAGGCGVVYLAEQVAPVRRDVALKIISLGMNSADVTARFEAERQVLALMDHPNIAKVHDAGSTASGRPYFVMELVRGIRITDYCNQLRLPVTERVTLFMQVCQAIQHAHYKGIVHRDIKPSNVLVTLVDGAPVVKVIDFGIAKATQGRLTEETLLTAMEQFVGTPAYVSPEQTEPGSLRVDTRSDVYSLGVLLYELLTASRPFESNHTSATAYANLRERIRSEEPIRLSIRIANSDRLTHIAELYRVSAKKLILEVRGDLDWIVLRCLEKEPVRRYQTANELWSDLRQFLRHEPIAARPHGFVYTLGKFARRHRVGCTTAAAILLILVASGMVTASMAVRLVTANALAEDFGSFVRDAMIVSTGAFDPEELDHPDYIGKVMAAAGQMHIPSVTNNKLSEAAAHEVLGSGYFSMGWNQPAAQQFGKALAIYSKEERRGDRWIAAAGAQLRALSFAGRYDLARAVGADALERLSKRYGTAHPKTRAFMEALAFYHLRQGSYEAARALLEPEVEGLIRGRLSIDLEQIERIASGAPLYRHPTEQRTGNVNLDRLEAMAILSLIYAAEGEQAGAEELARTVVAERTYALGGLNSETLMGVRLLGEVYAAGGKFGLAADALVESEVTKRRLVFLPNVRFLDVYTCGFSDDPLDDVARPWRAEKLIEQSEFKAQQRRIEHVVSPPMRDCTVIPIPMSTEAGVFPIRKQ